MPAHSAQTKNKVVDIETKTKFYEWHSAVITMDM